MVDDLPAVSESAEDLGSQIGRELRSGPLAVIAAGAHEGDVGRRDARLQQGVHHHRQDDLDGACRTGGIVEADRDTHARLRELLQRRGSVGPLDGLPGRDGGMGQCTRVLELDHGGGLGDRDIEAAIAEVDRGAQCRTGSQAESAERHGPGGSPHERSARRVPRMRALGTRIPARQVRDMPARESRWRSVANTPASVRATTPYAMVKARAHLVHGGTRPVRPRPGDRARPDSGVLRGAGQAGGADRAGLPLAGHRVRGDGYAAASQLRRPSLALCESTFGEFHDDVGGFVRPAPMGAFP